MMHPTSLLKRSHIMAQSVVMPSLILPLTSNPVQGQYLLTELDAYGDLPSTSKQPIQASFYQYPEHINVSLDQHCEPARKKRLTVDQTRSLEHSFALDSRLEPEKKNKLAHELGLQPRQVAIWYQNRRARTKTKDLEEKYDALHMQYQGVLEANKKLEAEVIKLREVLGLQEKVKLVAKGAKTFGEKNQKDNSISALSTNIAEAALSTIDTPQQQMHTQSKSVDETVDSEDRSCATAQGKPAYNATNMARDCNYNQSSNMFKHAREIVGMPIEQQDICHLNHQVLNHIHQHQQHQYQQPQHHEFLRQFQQHYQFSCFSNLAGDVKLENDERPVLPSTTLNQFDGHIVDDFRFSLEDETAYLYFELPTQA